MKKMKKFLAMMLAMAMVLGMSVTAFADEVETPPEPQAPSFTETKETITKPEPNQVGTVTITGSTIEEDKVTFTAYQLIKAKFDDGTPQNFEGYQWVDTYATDVTDKKPDNMISVTKNADGKDVVAGLTSANINKWAASAAGGSVISATDITWSTSGTEDKAVGTAKMKLGVGTWMIIATATNNAKVVYNPMIVSVYYEHTNTDGTASDWTVGGNVNADGYWTLVTSNAYQKASDQGGKSDKKVGTLVNGEFTEGAAYAQVGTTRGYELTGQIPSYSPEYFASVDATSTTKRTVTYVMKDSKNAGLEYVGAITVKRNKVTENGKDTYTEPVPATAIKINGEDVIPYEIKWYTDNTFTTEATATAAVTDSETGEVTTPAKTAEQNANAFTITFNSKYIESLAGLSADAREIQVTYEAIITSNAVNQAGENTFTVDYTRVPDGNSESTGEEKTVYTYTAAINGTIKKVDENHTPLSGAEFTLTYKDADGNNQIFGTVETTVEQDGTTTGNVKFAGLAFNTPYTLKETKAPDDYSINTTEYTITCVYPTDVENTKYFDADGKLIAYDVKIKNETTKEEETIPAVPYGGSANVLNNAIEFVNTTLSSLPSTGGIGTTIFTIGGCAIMIIAAGLYFSLRRKSAK